MKFIPKVSYGTGPTVLTFTQSQKLWHPKSKDVGGSNRSDAGIPETFIIRREYTVDVEIRFLESEWAAVDTWLASVIAGTAFDWWFDKDDNATKYTVYLESPSVGNEIAPKRDAFGKVFTLQLTFRTTTATRFTTPAFG